MACLLTLAQGVQLTLASTMTQQHRSIGMDVYDKIISVTSSGNRGEVARPKVARPRRATDSARIFVRDRVRMRNGGALIEMTD